MIKKDNLSGREKNINTNIYEQSTKMRHKKMIAKKIIEIIKEMNNSKYWRIQYLTYNNKQLCRNQQGHTTLK